MATQTANEKYEYDKVFFGKSLDEWVQDAHKENCKKNKWYYNALKKGAYGYDNLCMCLGNVLTGLENENIVLRDTENLSEEIHNGWVENYNYWKENKPWIYGIYSKPSKPIGDKRRDECARTAFQDLPDDEKEKDIIFVQFLQNVLE